MGYLIWYLQNHKDSKNVMKRALKVLLREDIETRYDKFKERKALTKEEYSDFCELCEVYFDLKGNGTGKHMYEEIKAKPIKGL